MIKLEDVSQIKIVYEETQVNEYLSKGYKILKIISSKIMRGEREEVLPCFVLGMIKEGK
jgi:hypothetical protein